MKAFLLAAGIGSRLMPYTASAPKCLMPIHGRPLLALWIDLLARHGVTDVLVNTHHLAPQVERAVARLNGQHSIRMATVHEPVLLGSAGTLWANRHFVAGEDSFLVAYADNLTDADLTAMARAHQTHRARGAALTMGLFTAPDPGACGIAVMDPAGKIVHFEEKPKRPMGNLANAGLYMAGREIFSAFPDPSGSAETKAMDIGFHLLPRLSGRIYGHRINGYLKDIGTVAAYHQALDDWPEPPHPHTERT
jgi:mannose-1-phosphate guanylyltransferase